MPRSQFGRSPRNAKLPETQNYVMASGLGAPHDHRCVRDPNSGRCFISFAVFSNFAIDIFSPHHKRFLAQNLKKMGIEQGRRGSHSLLGDDDGDGDSDDLEYDDEDGNDEAALCAVESNDVAPLFPRRKLVQGQGDDDAAATYLSGGAVGMTMLVYVTIHRCVWLGLWFMKCDSIVADHQLRIRRLVTAAIGTTNS
jgi:hypothetical protein